MIFFSRKKKYIYKFIVAGFYISLKFSMPPLFSFDFIEFFLLSHTGMPYTQIIPASIPYPYGMVETFTRFSRNKASNPIWRKYRKNNQYRCDFRIGKYFCFRCVSFQRKCRQATQIEHTHFMRWYCLLSYTFWNIHLVNPFNHHFKNKTKTFLSKFQSQK